MLLRSLVLFNRGGGLTTDSAMTKQLTTKNVRRPKAAGELLKRDRFRQQRVARGRDLYAKEVHVKSAMDGVSNARDVVLVQLADQIFSKGHTHVATATHVSFVPDGNPATPLVALAGRGKVGKTSLLRSLFRSAAQVGKSNRLLRRDAMNYFNVGDVFNIVDLPGFGGTSVPWDTVLQHAVLLRNFSRCQPSLKMLYYCMDVHYRNGLYVQDIDILKFLTQELPNFTIILTKGDQLNENDRSQSTFRVEDVRRELAFNDINHPVLVTSAYKMGGIDTLRYDMVMNAVHALPTERLTFTEAKRLSARLFSQKELGTVRNLAVAPTQLDDDVREWKSELALELAATPDSTNSDAPSPLPVVCIEGSPTSETRSPNEAFTVSQDELGSVLRQATHNGVSSEHGLAGFSDGDAAGGLPRQLPAGDALSLSPPASVPVVFPDEPDRQAAYTNLVKKAENKELLCFIQQTSPWRNPLKWPSHVVPTKHPKSNIMRCPEDPGNPYLTQAQFVAPRADMCFRRPNVGVRRCGQKGKYEADKPLRYLLRSYTIPYFPDIVDTTMHPQPWTFLGSRESYYEKGGGRQLGVRLSRQAREGEVQALSNNPAPGNAQLTEEVQKLERKRYGTPIAMLRPPSSDQDDATGKEPS